MVKNITIKNSTFKLLNKARAKILNKNPEEKPTYDSIIKIITTEYIKKTR